MLEAGADPSMLFSFENGRGTTLRSFFADELRFGSLQMLQILLDVGDPFINPNSTGNAELEEPPLLILAGWCWSDSCCDLAEKLLLLIERGANLHVRDALGRSCLHSVLRWGRPMDNSLSAGGLYDILMILVTGGATVSATTKQGQTVSDIARLFGYGNVWKTGARGLRL